MPRFFKRDRCPECGHLVQKGALLCADCGHRLGTERFSEHCGQCGARLASAFEDCPICGALRAKRRAYLSSGLVSRLLIVLVVGIVGFLGWRLHGLEYLRDRFQALAVEATQPPTPSPYPTWTPRPTLAPTDVPTVTPMPTRTLAPTATTIPSVVPTATVEVLRYSVKSGDTPLGIAVQFGIELAELLERNNLSETTLLQIGQELIISGSSGGPMPTEPTAANPTPTPGATAALGVALASSAGAAAPLGSTPEGAQPAESGQMPPLASAASSPSAGTPTASPIDTPEFTATPGFYHHVVEQGDMLLSLAQKYGVSVEEIIEINKLSPKALLNIGQRVIIPNITNTPTLSPTPGMTETPKPTLTPNATMPPASTGPAYPYLEPVPLAPVNSAVIEGAKRDVVLNWTSVGILKDDEWYLVDFWIPGDDVSLVSWTKATSLRVDSALYVPEQPDSAYHWQVQVAVRDEAGREAAVQSPPSARFRFFWR